MAEVGIPYTLTTPAGDLVFNVYDANGYLRLSDIGGLDSASLRTVIDPIPQGDGVIVSNSFQGGVTPVLQGHIVASDLTQRRSLEDALKRKLASILRADGTLKWPPTGAAVGR